MFLCLQEALYSQLTGIMDELGPSWTFIGVGRDDGRKAGEFSPIIYQSAVWKVVRWTTRWLNENGETGRKGWDAACTRIVTIGTFEHVTTGARIVLLNTHLDHIGEVARKESAKLIIQVSEEWIQKEHEMLQEKECTRDGYVVVSGPSAFPTIPVFLTGDFNSPPDDDAYKIITAPDSNWLDIQENIPNQERYGNRLTFTGFQPEKHMELMKRIDFVFAKNTKGAIFKSYGVMANRFDDGIFLSDHRAVVVDVDVDFMAENRK